MKKKCRCTWCTKLITDPNQHSIKAVFDCLNVAHWFHLDCYKEYKEWYTERATEHKDIG